MQGLGLKSSKASEKRKFKIELKTMMKRKRKGPALTDTHFAMFGF